MIVEVRNYRMKPGRRAEFVRLFGERTGPTQISLGMTIIGPLLDLEDPDVAVWLRGFPSMGERDRMKEAFYEGQRWKGELEGLVMLLLENYSVVVCQASPGLPATATRLCGLPRVRKASRHHPAVRARVLEALDLLLHPGTGRPRPNPTEIDYFRRDPTVGFGVGVRDSLPPDAGDRTASPGDFVILLTQQSEGR